MDQHNRHPCAVAASCVCTVRLQKIWGLWRGEARLFQIPRLKSPGCYPRHAAFKRCVSSQPRQQQLIPSLFVRVLAHRRESSLGAKNKNHPAFLRRLCLSPACFGMTFWPPSLCLSWTIRPAEQELRFPPSRVRPSEHGFLLMTA